MHTFMAMAMAMAIAVSALTNPIAAQTVTATKLVSYKKGKELLRKINNRWWTQDNREVNPPGKGGFFWEIDSEPGVVNFYHHQPFDLASAESLHLFMTTTDVEALLGQPNRIFPMGTDDGMWSYYAANGTSLEVRIMDGVLGEAQYEPVTGKPTPVASVAQDLNGRNIYSLLAEHAGQRIAETRAQRLSASSAPRSSRARSGTTRPSVTQFDANIPVSATAAPAPEKRIVPAEALATIKVGSARAEVLATLGEPSTRYSLSGGDELRETLHYYGADGHPVEIRLVDGKVTAVQ